MYTPKTNQLQGSIVDITADPSVTLLSFPRFDSVVAFEKMKLMFVAGSWLVGNENAQFVDSFPVNVYAMVLLINVSYRRNAYASPFEFVLDLTVKLDELSK